MLNQFKCPNGDSILTETCLKVCPHKERCLSLPTLQSLAENCKPRNLSKPSVTELLKDTTEAALMATHDTAISPLDLLWSMWGSGIHSALEHAEDGKIIYEKRFENDVFTGKIDCLGPLFKRSINTLLDHKVVPSYRALQLQGMYQVNVPTGQFYKTGINKGKEKFKKEWRTGGVRHILDYAIQLNAYRILCEAAGYRVDEMKLELFIRDYNTRIATERGLTSPVAYVKVNKISDKWIMRYMEAKAKRLKEAIEHGVTKPCSAKNRWNDNVKCKQYCSVASVCPWGKQVQEILAADETEAA